MLSARCLFQKSDEINVGWIALASNGHNLCLRVYKWENNLRSFKISEPERKMARLLRCNTANLVIPLRL